MVKLHRLGSTFPNSNCCSRLSISPSDMYLRSSSYEPIFSVWYTISLLCYSYHRLVSGDNSLSLNFLPERRVPGLLYGEASFVLNTLIRSPMSLLLRLSKSMCLWPEWLFMSEDSSLRSFKALNILPAVDWGRTSLGDPLKNPGFLKAS